MLADPSWETAQQPLEALQELIATALKEHCPRARPSPQAARRWSPRAAELLAGARQVRRRYNIHNRDQDLQSFKALSNQLKKELWRVSRDNWRRFVAELTTDPTSSRYNSL